MVTIDCSSLATLSAGRHFVPRCKSQNRLKYTILGVHEANSAESRYLTQSCFTPIFPTRRNPKAPTTQMKTIHANKVQKTARYPTKMAAGDSLSASPEAAVVESAMTDVIVNPIDVPSCAQVLNTAPPKACVRDGKTAEMTSRPTVKRTSGFRG